MSGEKCGNPIFYKNLADPLKIPKYQGVIRLLLAQQPTLQQLE
jgi:hypothetical protein